MQSGDDTEVVLAVHILQLFEGERPTEVQALIDFVDGMRVVESFGESGRWSNG